MSRVIIGTDEGQHVAIRLTRRSHPGRTDFWDGNWVEAEIQILAGGFRGDFRASLRSDEFERFHKDVRTLAETLKGSAIFQTMEGQLRVDLLGDGKGHVGVEGTALDQAGTGNSLQFRFELDQTYLHPIARDLGRILESFPVVGEP